MTEETGVVADFVSRFAKNPGGGGSDVATGRIVMNRRQLVIVGGDERLTIPFPDVVDVIVGNVPPELRDLFDSTVTIGYEDGHGNVQTVLIEGKEETISRFRTVLFRSLLSGTKAKIKHPARVGGRVTDEPVRKAKLSISPERVSFRTESGTFEIDLTTVVGFDRTERAPDGTRRPTLLIGHADEGKVTRSLIAPLSPRRLNLLGRFLRIEYGKLLKEVADIDLNESEKRLLVAVYATGGDIDFVNILDGDAARATNVVNSLVRKDLLSEDGDGIELTSKGQVVVNRRLEDVNI